MRSLRTSFLFSLVSLIFSTYAFSGDVKVEEGLTLQDLVRESSHIFIVSHSPPEHPVVSGLSVIHLHVHKILKSSGGLKTETIQVFHYHEDLLQKVKDERKSGSAKTVRVSGYKSPIALEAALKGKFIAFLIFRDQRFHFTAPGSYESIHILPVVKHLLTSIQNPK